MAGAAPTRQQAAQAFGLSARTLARRLQQEGLSYTALVDAAHRQVACDAVANSTRSFVDIAQSLGFAEASVFNRAFRRWTGSTPGQWRDTPAVRHGRG
jgi:AraC-like DNA-binding protein